MTIIRAENFSDFYERASRVRLSNPNGGIGDISYSDEVGFHLYSELSLTNELANPSTKESAERLVEVIQRYVDLAMCCLSNSSGRILEVQGERLHLFFPKTLSSQTANSLVTFCSAFTNAVYRNRSKLGNSAFNGFKICLDYGLSIILRTGSSDDDSIVSLGECANAPAKHLPEVHAEYTSISTKIAVLLFKDVDKRKNWYDINLYTRINLPIMLEQRQYDSILDSVRDFNPIYDVGRFTVETNIRTLKSSAGQQHGFFVKGLFMRADLDGFTIRVKEAFEKGTITDFVKDFCRVLKYGDEFIEHAEHQIVRLPWAGDCANMLVLPKSNESIRDAKYYYPATGPHEWLSGYDGIIPEPYPEAAWLVSICGGNDATGDCQTLVAPIEAGKHRFLFAAGWGVGRSLDAQNQDGVRANETIISKEDFEDLEDFYQKKYSMLNTVFAHALSLKNAMTLGQTVVPSLIAKSHPTSEKIADIVPQPRPYWK